MCFIAPSDPVFAWRPDLATTDLIFPTKYLIQTFPLLLLMALSIQSTLFMPQRVSRSFDSQQKYHNQGTKRGYRCPAAFESQQRCFRPTKDHPTLRRYVSLTLRRHASLWRAKATLLVMVTGYCYKKFTKGMYRSKTVYTCLMRQEHSQRPRLRSSSSKTRGS